MRTELGNFVTPSSYVAALISFKREALGLDWNSAIKDNVEQPGDVQIDAMQNGTTRVCKWFTMRPAPISFSSRTYRKLSV